MGKGEGGRGKGEGGRRFQTAHISYLAFPDAIPMPCFFLDDLVVFRKKYFTKDACLHASRQCSTLPTTSTKFYVVEKIVQPNEPNTEFGKERPVQHTVVLGLLCYNLRIRSLLSSSNSMTFPDDFFHDLFKYSMTLGLAVTGGSKIQVTFPQVGIYRSPSY